MDKLKIADREFNSRLFVGTGKFPSIDILKEVIKSSATELVTVALRRMDVNDPQDDFISAVNDGSVLLVPNTSGARDSSEALRLARLSRAAAGCEWVKLELTPEPRYLLPDPIETLKAAESLISEGFKVLPYINADPVLAKRLEDAGCPAVMPLGSPIGSNQGLKTESMLDIIIEQANVPVIVDAGLGYPSQACLAMEKGASAVLVNTAIATSANPAETACAFKLAVEAGRMSFLYHDVKSGRTAEASSPAEGFLESLENE